MTMIVSCAMSWTISQLATVGLMITLSSECSVVVHAASTFSATALSFWSPAHVRRLGQKSPHIMRSIYHGLDRTIHAYCE